MQRGKLCLKYKLFNLQLNYKSINHIDLCDCSHKFYDLYKNKNKLN